MSDIVIDHDLLAKLAQRASYSVPQTGIVFFSFRGMLPLDTSGTVFAASHKARLVGFDHLHMRCTLGQWRPAERKIALFPGSTVPHLDAIKKARMNNGIGANMLMPGRYAYDRGVHKAGSATGHRAFRQGMFFPVWRNSDDLDYDLNDRLDRSGVTPDLYPWDNMHCAHADNVDMPKFSSNGCQVIAGRPTMPANGNKPESGPWKRFIEHAYGADANGQTRFVYLLFSGAEAGALSAKPDGPLSRTVRFGSSGEWVTKVQAALKDRNFGFLEVDNEFGRDTLEALMAFQLAEFGPGQADGIVGPNTASALALEWPPVSFARTTPSALAGPPADWQAAATRITPGFETTGDPYLGVSGDFDGMGISCGALQWNIGQNSLQPMVQAAGENVVLGNMPELGRQMWQACTGNLNDGLAIVRAWQAAAKLNPVARAELKSLMGSPEMRAQQDAKIASVASTALQRATQWAQSVGRASATKREFLWFFDLVTQNGGLKELTISDVRGFIDQAGAGSADDVVCDFLAGLLGTNGHIKDANKNAALWRNQTNALTLELLVLSYLRAGKSVPQWRHIVLNRKATIAMGKGWVNGTLYDLSGDMG
jgi:hypothetical protein